MDDDRDPLRLGPIDIDKHNWLYTEPQGVLFVHQTYDSHGRFVQTDHVLIPWHIIRVALAIKDKRRRPRKRAKAA